VRRFQKNLWLPPPEKADRSREWIICTPMYFEGAFSLVRLIERERPRRHQKHRNDEDRDPLHASLRFSVSLVTVQKALGA
jgi:hypothetical protein